MTNDLAVKKSKIEGKGVFADRDFKKGEIIIKWNISHQLAPEEAKKLPESEKRFLVYFREKNILMQAPAKYVNHSCNANTYAENFCDIAKRDIRKGEEITANYSETMNIDEFMKCKCGSKNCRKIIKAKQL
ncbi:MAG TPA: SET domain-containing protein-lysine N-methyltransferase [archaeon]|nr:SET domain-containing protein-lysine N-methyltransferase [archaeon]